MVDEAPTALYRFYDLGLRLLYVGVSDSLAVRWGRHAATSLWWPEVAIKTVEWHSTRRDVLAAETAAIAAESPGSQQEVPAD
jgi:hypothetical protein